ncbi:MAG: XRE family transcriptional regulator [Dehalococcoidia bacterium]|nr:XRE family transcriptional regulator [Dehalococcoidia bacterium]
MAEESIGKRLRRLRLEAGLSQRELARRSGVDREYICQIEAGKTKSMTLRLAQRLAKGLDKPPGVFFGESQDLKATPKTSLADLELSINAYMPVYAEVSAGEGIEPIDYVACTRKEAAPETLRAYRVKGLCLKPEIEEGDTVIVDTQLSPTNGDLVLVIIEGQASVKRYREGEGRKWLENNSGNYQPEDVYLHGVVVGFYRARR